MNRVTISVKEITDAEIPRCAKVVRDSFATVAADFSLTRQNCASNPAFLEDEKLRQERGRGVLLFGLYEGSEQAGFVALEKNSPDLWFLEKLAVLPTHRHKGYGTRLMDHCRSHVRQQGGKRISIGIIFENTVLLHWYEAYGFTRTALKTFPHLPFTVCLLEITV